MRSIYRTHRGQTEREKTFPSLPPFTTRNNFAGCFFSPYLFLFAFSFISPFPCRPDAHCIIGEPARSRSLAPQRQGYDTAWDAVSRDAVRPSV